VQVCITCKPVDISDATQIIVTIQTGSVRSGGEGGVRVSLQVAIMLVLSGHPDGRATVTAMKADLVRLAGAGQASSQRLRRLADRAPGLDIFTEGFVVRDDAGWQLTDAGRKILRRLEPPLRTNDPVDLETNAAPIEPVRLRLSGVIMPSGPRADSQRRPVALRRSA
jgi:hypothetical protein